MNSSNGLPQLDLTTFFLSVSAAAMQSIQGTEVPRDLVMAQQNIELLDLMQSKTQGNRTPEEDQLLGHLLFQLRMSFIEAEKK